MLPSVFTVVLLGSGFVSEALMRLLPMPIVFVVLNPICWALSAVLCLVGIGFLWDASR